MSSEFVCPFCGSSLGNQYLLLFVSEALTLPPPPLMPENSPDSQHVETRHAEGKSPFVVDGDEAAPEKDESPNEEDQFAECPVDGCGEVVTLAELEDHIELHGAEQPEEPPTPVPDSRQGRVSAQGSNSTSAKTRPVDGGYRSPYSQSRDAAPRPRRAHKSNERVASREHNPASAVGIWKQIFAAPPQRSRELQALAGGDLGRRLGKSELGRYAHEDRMPDWLVSLLKTGGYESSEGGFCGYRNIQMLSSYIVGASAPGAEALRDRIPSIFRIQDYIEKAWDMGINTQGRIETGGVKGTRKYIGTPEQNFLIPTEYLLLTAARASRCEAQAFKNTVPDVAAALLLDTVRAYFESAPCPNPEAKVRCTSLPPIYFQHRGHSLTIIGLERRRDGGWELLVFDPMFRDPDGITRYIGRRFQHRDPERVLKLYRRGAKYLKKYHEFEILRYGNFLIPSSLSSILFSAFPHELDF
ncbi:peptidase family C78-domain-containing protein [Durotheca rogersii]|uniref:peptidase family C78-domain-containing protein n=1 Tax=Durotheca rogersii TaxID=419775 RepID=UPI002220E0D1|nr:peptidase family C78-domain-containing protein [Durotheca rogersii]KAI5862841.1 peptidase family C78-domain-containing protein [Durotheca rogersii]